MTEQRLKIVPYDDDEEEEPKQTGGFNVLKDGRDKSNAKPPRKRKRRAEDCDFIDRVTRTIESLQRERRSMKEAGMKDSLRCEFVWTYVFRVQLRERLGPRADIADIRRVRQALKKELGQQECIQLRKQCMDELAEKCK